MKIEIPVFNEDGSVKFNAELSSEEAQAVLQFGLNFAIASGLAQQLGIQLVPAPADVADDLDMDQLDLFEGNDTVQ
jgi:hypothetical protein